MILVSLYSAYAQPSLVFDKGIDKAAMKGLLAEIPESYFEGVSAIYFTDTPYRYNRGNQITVGMFYKDSITLYDADSFSYEYVKEVLLHELGHSQWARLSEEEQQTYCRGEITGECEEQFADGFAERNNDVRVAA
ncbi:hypothetical protein HYV81_05300 [Candidatus Woesearchaeota archaeon]|nr:hypothetical protein [Candidatus Woesearchaeota archaeon]